MRFLTFLLLFLTWFVGAQSKFERAERLLVQGNYILAKSVFEIVLEQNPNDLKTLQYLGEIACKMKSFDKALFYFERLKKIRPTQADYYYLYGGALALKAQVGSKIRALGMIGDIRESFEKAIALNPKHVEARWALIEYYLQVPGIFGGSEQKATKYANELLQISPVDGYLAKGHIDEYFERYKEAEKNYSKAHEIGNSKMTCQKLADLYKNKLNQPQKAKRVLENFSEKNKT